MPGYAELDAILRRDLNAFVHKVFTTVSPNDRFEPNWHIEAITYQLMRCYGGENRRLAITQPPRSLKSICTSVAFVAWALGHNPGLRFLCVSYSDALATEFTRQFRMVVESSWYKRVFPAMRLKKETRTECITTRGGGRVAVSVGGSVTGRGADYIIIDDPLKAEDGASEGARNHLIDWYDGTLSTRLNDKERGVIILVMQRLHQDDLAGHLLRRGPWYHLNLPAIALEDQRIDIDIDEVYHRRPGELLHPARESREALERIKSDLGSLRFSAQYQQSPVPPEGNLIKRKWFKVYDTAPERQPGVRIAQSWDIATATGERNDYSVCTSWAIKQKDFYLLDVWRGRVEFPALRRKVIDHAMHYGAQTVLIEKAGPGLQLVQDLRQDTTPRFPKPIGITPEGEKLLRMEAQTPRLEAGHVLLPKEAPWLAAFLEELRAFPSGRHDDQVDSVSQFLKWAWSDVSRPYAVGYGKLFVGDSEYHWD
ncbi:phage terminase large subunit [Pelagibius sp.]|uniref:phage terminase large subunit n=1 Tax=Pelagibius sp. TaxID=1931238 RepID=UPI003B5101C1